MSVSQRYSKTIVFLNLRFADFYSDNLLSLVKQSGNIRVVAVIDDQFSEKSSYIKSYFDEIYKLQSKPKDGFLGEFDYKDLSAIIIKEKISTLELRIVCADEFNLLNAGKLRKEFNLQGHSDETLIFFRDKLRMKELLSSHHIRVPRFKSYEQADTFESIVEEVGLPFVLKPIDSCGSHGVNIINDSDDFCRFKADIENTIESIEAEEFIAGTLYHVDTLIKNNEVKFICANECTYPNHEYTKGKVLGSIPLDSKSNISKRLIKFAKKCISALGANNLVTHMEIFETKNNELIFLEVSARPPGGLLNLTHRVNFGINLTDEDFFLQTDIDIQLNLKHSHKHAFFALFPLIPGKIIKLVDPEIESNYDIKWYVNPGEIIANENCGNIVSKSAHVIVYNSNKNTLRRDFKKIKTHRAVEVG